ncbi:amidohydrolase family protein, partial [Acetobacter sp.]|uniref:amidohydrolase family protein n=1 Tax=Acetobacter sp. TaxID=440 RepID=UPI0039E829F0
LVWGRNGGARPPGVNRPGWGGTGQPGGPNAVQAGLPLHQAAVLLTRNPARYLGLHDRGTLHAGKRADFVVMDNALTVQEVWVAGQRIA